MAVLYALSVHQDLLPSMDHVSYAIQWLTVQYAEELTYAFSAWLVSVLKMESVLTAIYPTVKDALQQISAITAQADSRLVPATIVFNATSLTAPVALLPMSANSVNQEIISSTILANLSVLILIVRLSDAKIALRFALTAMKDSWS